MRTDHWATVTACQLLPGDYDPETRRVVLVAITTEDSLGGSTQVRFTDGTAEDHFRWRVFRVRRR